MLFERMENVINDRDMNMNMMRSQLDTLRNYSRRMDIESEWNRELFDTGPLMADDPVISSSSSNTDPFLVGNSELNANAAPFYPHSSTIRDPMPDPSSQLDSDAKDQLESFNNFFKLYLPSEQELQQGVLKTAEVLSKRKIQAELHKYKQFKQEEFGYDSTWSDMEQILDGNTNLILSNAPRTACIRNLTNHPVRRFKLYLKVKESFGLVGLLLMHNMSQDPLIIAKMHSSEHELISCLWSNDESRIRQAFLILL